MGFKEHDIVYHKDKKCTIIHLYQDKRFCVVEYEEDNTVRDVSVSELRLKNGGLK